MLNLLNFLHIYSKYQEFICLGILQGRSELEQQSIETANTSDAVGFITYVQSLKRKMKSWEKQVDVSENKKLAIQ